jgi:hypothetical protein
VYVDDGIPVTYRAKPNVKRLSPARPDSATELADEYETPTEFR